MNDKFTHMRVEKVDLEKIIKLSELSGVFQYKKLKDVIDFYIEEKQIKFDNDH